MKTLSDILENLNPVSIHGSQDIQINSIEFDSRNVEADSLFVAIKGTQVDGHLYIDIAIQNGAKAIICESIPKKLAQGICYIKVENAAEALGTVSDTYYDSPSVDVKLIGVTGTNGKTTIVSLLHKLYTKLGYNCGLISTIQNIIGDKVVHATHTTPDAVSINKLLAEMVKEGVEYCFMEVSSHAIDQGRINGLKFTGGIFTNLTHDHLDYHLTFDHYLKTKKRFFDLLPKSSFALTNGDEKNGKIMLQNTKAIKYTYGLRGTSDFNCKIIENQFIGLQLSIEHHNIWFRLIGQFNAYNLMAIYAASVIMGQEKNEVLTHLSNLESAEGRFDQIKSENNIIAIVDYAHTPDALMNVLDTISSLRSGNEQLICVLGAGGNRDKSKRPLMASIAVQRCDKVILTSDNPRNEDPEIIITEMKTGVDPSNKRKLLSITNRKEAIKTAAALANSGDIILIAGKGHEKYQLIKGVKIHFDDKEIIKEALMTN